MSAPTLPQALLTSAQVADLLGFSEGRLRQWRMEDKGPEYVRVNRSIRYRPEAVAAWLDLNTQAAS